MTLLIRESLSNTVQLFVMIALSALMLVMAPRAENRTAAWIMTGGFLCAMMGNLFWSLYILLRKETPPYFSASDIAWIGSYCFFVASYKVTFPQREKVPWTAHIPAATVLCNIPIWIWYSGGHIAQNLIWGAALTMFAFYTGEALYRTRDMDRALRMRAMAQMLFLTAELLLFVSYGSAYYIFDFIVTAAYIALALTFVRKRSAA
jgi:hypothetical protein